MFHIGDFNHATRHLEKLERWFYRDLIDMYYDTEEPIPSNIDLVFRKLMAKSDEEKAAVQQVLNEFFIITDEGCINVRCQHQIDVYQNQTASKSKAGKASAEARAAKKALKDKAKNKSSTPVEQNSTSAHNQEPRTKNHKDIHQDELDVYFENFWNAGMRRVGKKKCKALFKSILNKMDDPAWWTEFMITDIRKRIEIKQFGFSKMHPQTYLNGERWNDDYVENTSENIRTGASASDKVSAAIQQAINQQTNTQQNEDPNTLATDG